MLDVMKLSAIVENASDIDHMSNTVILDDYDEPSVLRECVQEMKIITLQLQLDESTITNECAEKLMCESYTQIEREVLCEEASKNIFGRIKEAILNFIGYIKKFINTIKEKIANKKNERIEKYTVKDFKSNKNYDKLKNLVITAYPYEHMNAVIDSIKYNSSFEQDIRSLLHIDELSNIVKNSFDMSSEEINKTAENVKTTDGDNVGVAYNIIKNALGIEFPKDVRSRDDLVNYLRGRDKINIKFGERYFTEDIFIKYVLKGEQTSKELDKFVVMLGIISGELSGISKKFDSINFNSKDSSALNRLYHSTLHGISVAQEVCNITQVIVYANEHYLKALAQCYDACDKIMNGKGEE